MDDYSPMKSSSSIGFKQTRLFDEAALAAEQSRDSTLQLLANCVYLVNSTILRERRLIPADSFNEFCVYGDTYGYLVDDSTESRRQLVKKLNAPNEKILGRDLHKLAIVVEENLNTKPVETYIWTFSYDSTDSASAEIGYRGRKTKFSVQYNDMRTTCLQFCQLFSEIKKILSNLRPLPPGMVPSLKVASRGDPEIGEGFFRVEEFVDPKQISVGSVAFAFDTGFNFSYASQYVVESYRPQTPEPMEYANYERSEDIFKSPVDPIEVTRRNTMNFEEKENYSRPASPVLQNNDSLANISMNCNPSAPSRPTVLPSGINEAGNITLDDDADVNMVDPTNEADAETVAVTKCPEKIDEVAIEKKTTGGRGRKQKTSVKKRSERTRPARSVEKKVKTVKIPKLASKKSSARRLSDMVVTDNEEDKIVENQEERKDDQIEPMDFDMIEDVENPDPIEEQPIRRYARVSSLTVVVNGETNDEVQPPLKNPSISGLIVNDDADNEVEEVEEEHQKRVYKKYARVASLLDVVKDPVEEEETPEETKTTKRFGFAPVSTILQEQSIRSRGPSENRDSPKNQDRYCRVPSLLDIAGLSPISGGNEDQEQSMRQGGSIHSAQRVETQDSNTRPTSGPTRKFAQSSCLRKQNSPIV